MKSTFLIGGILSLAAPIVRGQGSRALKFGPGYDFKVSAGKEIIRAETTYTPGAMEKSIKGILFLWPGLLGPRKPDNRRPDPDGD